MTKKRQLDHSFILYPKQDIREVRACVLENYGRIKYELPFLNALCVAIPTERIDSIRTNRRVAAMTEDAQVSKLSDDRPPSLDFTQRRPPSFAPSRGEGVVIAVVDTGVSPHYDLIKPFNRILYFQDFINQRLQPYDDDGHGTHVAGIALGNGYVAPQYKGAAPNAGLVALKALDNEGNGNASDILAALQWIYDHHKEYHIRVVNLSLGVAPSSSIPVDPLVLGVNALVCQGLSVVVAGGNSGPKKGTITSPGTSPLALTVGSCDDAGAIPDFSSRGPTPAGLVKPDFLAPGVDIVSLSNETPKGYVSQSGTSMSAPFVSGLAACCYSRFPHASPSDIRTALVSAARPIKKADPNAQGYGLLSKDSFSVYSI